MLAVMFGLCITVLGCTDDNGASPIKPTYDTTKFKVIPYYPTTLDSVRFAVYSQPFSGDCTYEMTLDSVKNNYIYINGIFNGNNKCMGEGINDTVNIGMFPTGSYYIIYSFIDIHDNPDTRLPKQTDTINFSVIKK